MKHGQGKHSGGFSLVEIMVGLTIGLITVLVVGQVLQVAEARRRQSTSGADATVNAGLAIYALERDGKNAGYGMTISRDSVGCELRSIYNGTAQPASILAPAIINDGASGAADTVQFKASTKVGITLPTRITVDHAKTDASFMVESDLGMQAGDILIAVPAALNTATPATTWCTVLQYAGTSAGQNQIPHVPGTQWNPLVASSILPTAGYLVGDYLINLGTYSDHTYSINSNQLRMSELVASTNTSSNQDLIPNMVQLQAVYGKDTSGDGIVDVWNATAPTTAAEWQQIRALRIALVARSQTPEASTVTLDGANGTSSCNSTTPHPAAVCWRPDPNGNGVKIDVNIGNSTPDWQRYQYRVVETTIPLRNVIWQQ